MTEEREVAVDVLSRCGVWEDSRVSLDVSVADFPLYQKALDVLAGFKVIGDPPSALIEPIHIGRVVPGGRLQVMVRVAPGKHCRLFLPAAIAHCLLCGREAPDLTVVQGTFRLIWDKVSLDLEVVKPSEEEVTEVEETAGTPLEDLGLSARVHNALCRSGALAEVFGLVDPEKGVLKRRPYVEEILGVLEDKSKGEEFLLWNVRFFGPKSLEELKTALREHGFLPAEETEEE